MLRHSFDVLFICAESPCVSPLQMKAKEGKPLNETCRIVCCSLCTVTLIELLLSVYFVGLGYLSPCGDCLEIRVVGLGKLSPYGNCQEIICCQQW